MPPYVSSDRLAGLVDVNRRALGAGTETAREGFRLRTSLTLPVGPATDIFNLPIPVISTRQCLGGCQSGNCVLQSIEQTTDHRAFAR